MKSFNLFYFVLLLAIAFSSCTKDKELETDILNEQVTQRHKLNGFEPFDPCSQNITVCLKSCDLFFQEALTEAIEEFNNVPNSDLVITLDCEGEADIEFECSSRVFVDCEENQYAVIDPNSYSSKTRRIYLQSLSLNAYVGCCYDTNTINYNSNPNDQGNALGFINLEDAQCFWKRLMLKNLLNAVGINGNNNGYSESYIEGSCTGGESIDDPNVPCEELAQNCSLTACDILAIQKVYPDLDPCDCYDPSSVMPDVPYTFCVGTEFSLLFNPSGFNNFTYNVALNGGNDFDFDPVTGILYCDELTSTGLVIIEITWEHCGETHSRTIIFNVTDYDCD